MPPGDVLDRVRELLDNQGKLDGVEARWTVEGDVPDVVMEPQQLEQVLVNLALNAIDAMEEAEEPELLVSVGLEDAGASLLPIRRVDDPPGINYMHRRRVSKDDEGRGVDTLFNAEHVVVIRVVDNGPGIPPQDLDNIFDPFFTTKELGKGTGLGLSICARLVEGMGGQIQASNEPEGGACFTIRLPSAPRGADAGSDAEPAPTEAREPT